MGSIISILISTFFVSYVIGVSDASNAPSSLVHNHIVSCEPDLPCDYTSIGAVILGFALSAFVALTVYFKQRQVSKKLDDHANSHISVATNELPPYLESIRDAALILFENPLPSENFRNNIQYRLVIRNMNTIRDIYLISGSFLDPDLVHDLIVLYHWIENDFQFLIMEQNPLGYYRLRTEVQSILDNYFN